MNCCQSCGALLPHPFTLTGQPFLKRMSQLRRSTLCGTFRRLSPPRRYLAPCPMEPGLSSPLHKERAATVQPSCGRRRIPEPNLQLKLIVPNTFPAIHLHLFRRRNPQILEGESTQALNALSEPVPPYTKASVLFLSVLQPVDWPVSSAVHQQAFQALS